MTRQLFIAEKPSLAKEIAQALGEKNGVRAEKGNGAWTVGEDKVTWLFGHMYEQFTPPDYDIKFKQWSIGDLPIVPDKWKLKVSKDKADHIRTINQLIKGAKSVVNAGDAAREGQLLVDEVLVEAGWDPFSDKTHRLWVRSVARKDLLEALGEMNLNQSKEALYNSAVCRQRADWLHGLNLTRLYSIKARQAGADQMISVGRVQTPTLKLVVDRDLEIKNFKAVDHYLPSGIFVHEKGKFKANWVIPTDGPGTDSEGRLVDKSVAEEVLARISGKEGKISEFKATDKKKEPPLPYALSSLQMECSAKFGLSAQETLDMAQKLYETHKVTTYPRSDSKYLPNSIYQDEAPKILANLKGMSDDLGRAAEGSNGKLKSKAWNDSKVSDHHAIIPTTEATPAKISSLTGMERKVFDLIAKTFIAQFYPDQRWKSLSATVAIDKDKFKATGRHEIDAGWKIAFAAGKQEADEDQEEDTQTLPVMSKNDPVSVDSGTVQSKRTTPPSPFTDGKLIEAMTNIHKFVTDSETKKRLKENDGIGTEATRANIIETLIKRRFLIRKGKNKLLSTDTGQSVILALPADVTDPGLTAIWESYLEKVSKGELDLEKFMEVQIKNVTERVKSGKEATVKIKGAKTIVPLKGHGEQCKKCGKGVMITREIRKGEHKGKKFLSCDQYPECDSVIWEDIEPIEGHGKECPKCKKGKMLTRQVQKGEHKGKKFLSCDQYRKSGCNHSEWPKLPIKPAKGHGKDCPKCSTGKMETRKSKKGTIFLGCNNYPECDAVEWLDSKPSGGGGGGAPKNVRARPRVNRSRGKS